MMFPPHPWPLPSVLLGTPATSEQDNNIPVIIKLSINQLGHICKFYIYKMYLRTSLHVARAEHILIILFMPKKHFY